MRNRLNKNSKSRTGKLFMLLITLLIAGVVLASCTGQALPRGWSGMAVADGRLFLGSTAGAVVVIDITDGSTSNEVTLKAPAAFGGLFGCAAAPGVVAIYGTPTVVGESVYVGGYDGKIYDISAESGRYKGEYLDILKSQPIVGGTVVDQGIIYVGSANGSIYALDATNFQEEWQFPTGDKIWSTPTIEGNTLYIGSFDKNLYAINTHDGSKLWEFITDGAIIAPPLIDDNVVYIGSFDRHLYAVDAVSGNKLWQFPADDAAEATPINWFWAQLVIGNGTIYAGNLDGYVYIIDAATGQPQADAIDLESPIASSLVVVDDTVIVATEDGLIYTINTVSNQHQLLADIKRLADETELTIRSALTVNDGILYVHAQTKKHGSYVCALDAATGAMQWGRLLNSE